MSENECKCNCNSECNKCNSECNNKCSSKCKDWSVIIGGIVIYQLAIVIVLLILIFLNFSSPCGKLHSIATESEKAGLEE